MLNFRIFRILFDWIWNCYAKDINKKRKQKRIKERRRKKREKGYGPEQPGLAQWRGPAKQPKTVTAPSFLSLPLTGGPHCQFHLPPLTAPSLSGTWNRTWSPSFPSLSWALTTPCADSSYSPSSPPSLPSALWQNHQWDAAKLLARFQDFRRLVPMITTNQGFLSAIPLYPYALLDLAHLLMHSMSSNV
jgi:hypothetical protein